MKALVGITVFTVVELVAFAVWLIGSGVHISTAGQIGLAVLLEVEHLLAYNVGAGRRLFSIPGLTLG